MKITHKRTIVSLFCLLFSGILLLSGCGQNAAQDNNESGRTLSSAAESGKNESDANETGVHVEGAVISWANMKIDNPDLNLTDEQLGVLKYFDRDYLPVSSYDNLQKYPKIYRNAQIRFQGTVIKMLETNDETYQCLIWMNGYLGGKDGEELIQPNNEDLLVISGKHPDDARIIEGDWLECYGRYIDVQPFSIDGEQKYYPYVTINDSVPCGQEGAGDRFDLSDVKLVAKTILGNDIKIKEPVCGEDFELDQLHNPQYRFYLVTPDNQTNANFSRFEFARAQGFIRDANSTAAQERTFLVSADFQHYIVTVYDRNLNLMYLEYYDRSFQKLWSREFENVDNAVLDYTNQSIYLASDNDLYIINTIDGKDQISPVMIGEKVKINVVKDGIVMIGTGNKDNVMKTDLKGNIIWKASADLEVSGCSMVQIIDGTIVANLIHTKSEQMDVKFGGGEQITDYISKMIAIDSEGHLVSEFIDSEYHQ